MKKAHYNTQSPMTSSMALFKNKNKMYERIACVSSRFPDFQWIELNAKPSAHKRNDMADLGDLESFLSELGLGHAFQHIFGAALNT